MLLNCHPPQRDVRVQSVKKQHIVGDDPEIDLQRVKKRCIFGYDEEIDLPRCDISLMYRRSTEYWNTLNIEPVSAAPKNAHA